MGIGRQIDLLWSRKAKMSKGFSALVRAYRVSIGALALAAGGCAIALYQAIQTGHFLGALLVGISTFALVLAPLVFKNVIEWRPSQELLDEIGIQSLGSLDRTSKVLRSTVNPELLSGWHNIIADDNDYRSLVGSIELALLNSQASSIFVADIGAESQRENFTKSLASTYSAIGYRTVAVDLGFNPSFESLRPPDQPEHPVGFYDVITKQSSVREALLRSGEIGSSLLYLPSGRPAQTASSPYLSPRLTETIRYLGDNSDRVIMSGGSAVGDSEELVPACTADCVVILARRSACSEAIVRQAVRNLSKTGTPIIGICFIEEPVLLSAERTPIAPTDASNNGNSPSESRHLEQLDVGPLIVEDDPTAGELSSEIETPLEAEHDSDSDDVDRIEYDTDLGDASDVYQVEASDGQPGDSDLAHQDSDTDAIDQFEDNTEPPADDHATLDANNKDAQIDDSDADELAAIEEQDIDLRDESSDAYVDSNVFDKAPPDPALQPNEAQDQNRGILSDTDSADRYNSQKTEPLLQRLQFWKKHDQPFPARAKTAEPKPEPIAKPIARPLGVPVEDSGGSLFGTRIGDDHDPLLAETVELETLFDIDAFDGAELADSSIIESETLEQSDT